ncbi:MAG: phosphate ABC transporter, permease protein PstA, partial [Cryobacterium sp.]|nr:phosphate ABC transporter, permease protein PstA [Cryobacterium sp.]
MTTTAAPDVEPESSSTAALPQLYSPLPTWGPYAVGALALVLALGVRALLGGGPITTALVAAVLFTVAINLVSRQVEGRRRAADRTVTALVSVAFAAAMLPLISLVYTVVSRGAGRFDAVFFNETMRNVVGAGGGAKHAVVGTLIITGIAALISVPIGLLTAIYLVEYGRGRLARSITFLVDVMNGIPSLVAGLFANPLLVIILGPGVRLGIGGAV